MSSIIEAVEQAVKAAAERIDGVAEAFDYEPDLDTLALPCVTIVWDGFSQVDVETGGATDNTWTWDIAVYVGREQGARESQQQLKRIVINLLTLIRDDPTVATLVDWATIGDGGPPYHDPEAGTLVKTIRLTARTTER